MSIRHQPIGVASFGEVLWDVYPGQKKLGGAPANFACYCHQLGAKASLISAVGRDSLGTEAIRQVALMGVDTSMIQQHEHLPTGVVHVTLDTAGQPQFQIAKDSAWDDIHISDLTDFHTRPWDIFYFGSLAQRAPASAQTLQFLLTNLPRQCLRFFDANFRLPHIDQKIITVSLQQCDVLKINAEELTFLQRMFGCHGSPVDQMSDLLSRFPISTIALTLGGEGSILMQRGGQAQHLPATNTRVLDTVGAGDAFASALAMGILLGKSLLESHQLASNLAAHACSVHGAIAMLPDHMAKPFLQTPL